MKIRQQRFHRDAPLESECCMGHALHDTEFFRELNSNSSQVTIGVG